MKLSLVILSISLVYPVCFGQATNIDALFGIKLGQALPASCTNSDTLYRQPDEWGFQMAARLVPPAPNSAFTNFTCYVKLTPTNRLVCEIDIYEEGMDSTTYDGILGVLRHHYGPENSNMSGNVNGKEARVWLMNHRRLILTYDPSDSTQKTFLMCQDDLLLSHPNHVTDTNGL
ncbi:MAG TPA: hypothetical protein VGN23_07500 [Verrucomicrobiae bacterium]|jgi:hypothetical protein